MILGAWKRRRIEHENNEAQKSLALGFAIKRFYRAEATVINPHALCCCQKSTRFKGILYSLTPSFSKNSRRSYTDTRAAREDVQTVRAMRGSYELGKTQGREMWESETFALQSSLREARHR